MDTRARRIARHGILAAALLGIPSTSCASRGRNPTPSPAGSATLADTRVVKSNVTRADYVGSAACVPCHPTIASNWERSPMHLMTRNAPDADVRAPFDGTRWRFKSDAVVLERRGQERFVRLEPAADSAETYRVTRVIGGRTREDFVGVEASRGGAEVVLPVSFVFATRSLRYKGYSVMVHERASLRAGPVWSRTCIFCHNTIPEMDRFLGAIIGPKAPAYQGQSVDRWLPEDRRERPRVIDAPGFSRAVAAEVVALGGVLSNGQEDVTAVARRAVDVTRAAFAGEALLEVGIGCEACHGGSREHASDPTIRPTFTPVAPWLDVRSTNPASPREISRVCARCHQVLFSRYPFTWEGGKRDTTAGGSHINSGEARDFLLGGCTGAMSCTHCHDPHGAQDEGALRALAAPAHNATCTACHEEFAEASRLREHAHHEPGGPGGACVACHMPRKNMGLDGTLTRYHRIGSPTDPARVLGDRPLECALCHADRGVGALVDVMEKWWPVRYPRQRLEDLYGSLEANVLRATLERGKPHEQAVAAAALAEAGARDAAPAIAKQLLNPYPLVREWAKRALVTMLGRCDVDLAADDATIERDAAACAGVRVIGPVATPSADEEPED